MTLRALLLDFGGTLATETPSRGALYARSARARGLDVDDERMGTLMGAAHHALPRHVDGRPRYSDAWFARFIEEVFHGMLGLPRADLPGLREELFARFSDAASFRVFPGARELLSDAKARGLRTALVSNWSEHLDELLTNLGLRSGLDVVLTSALVGAEKPEPAIFRAALAALGVAPEEALHAGNDVDCDVRGAAVLGIRPVLVEHGAPPGCGMMEETAGAPRVSSLTELRALIARDDAP